MKKDGMKKDGMKKDGTTKSSESRKELLQQLIRQKRSQMTELKNQLPELQRMVHTAKLSGNFDESRAKQEWIVAAEQRLGTLRNQLQKHEIELPWVQGSKAIQVSFMPVGRMLE